MSPSEIAPKDRGTILAEERTDLALERTRIAGERTLLAWIRTALSMIGSGFAIFNFFRIQAAELPSGALRRPQTARNLGLTLIGVGTLALIGATWQHWTFLHAIGLAHARHVRSISFVVAIAVILIGFVTFYGVLLRAGPF